jgi:predicted Zn-dependent protease
MRLHPNDPQVLQLLVLLDQHQGRQSEATAALTARFKGLEPGQRMEIGLLLADLLRQGGSPQTAKTLYHQLAEEEPTNPRPLLALALLLQEQGHGQETQALLKQARQRRDANGLTDPSIDRLAGQLGLSTARNNSAEQRGSTGIRAGSGAP